MITTSTTYKEIIAGTHGFEHRIIIGSGDSAHIFGANSIRSLKISGGLFAENDFSLGGCFAREVEVQFYPGTYIPPRMSAIEVQFRATSPASVSEWLTAGFFFFDTREKDDSGMMTVKGYDAMLKGEKTYIDPGDVGNWPKKMSEVAADIASKMSVTLDPRCTFQNYDVQLPTGYTMREILGYIAAAHCANWVITPGGMLRMISPGTSTNILTLGKNVMTFETGREQSNWTHVIVNIDDENYVEAAATIDSGRTIEVTCPWGTTTMAENILTALKDYVYRPFAASGALLDPAAEIGDQLSVNGTESVLAMCETTYDALCAADISAPSEDEIDHEYPYISTANRQIKRRLKTIETTLYVGAESIVATVQDIDGRITKVSQTADKIDWLVKSGTSESDFTMTDRAIEQVASQITLTGYVTFNDLEKTGKTTINGDNITTGTISADRIDVSQLKVSRIYSGSTSGKIAIDCTSGSTLYIGGSTSESANYGEIRLYSEKVTIGSWAWTNQLSIDTDNSRIASNNQTGTWEIGSSTYPFGKIYLGNSTTGGSLTIESGKLVLNGTALTLGDTDTLKSGTNSISLSSTTLTPAANDTYALGSSSRFWSDAYIGSLKICYSTTKSITLACNSSGKLTIGGTEFDPSSSGSVSQLKSGSYTVSLSSSTLSPGSSASYNFGSSSALWNYLYCKYIRLYYNSYKYVELACNYDSKLTVDGKVVTTA